MRYLGIGIRFAFIASLWLANGPAIAAEKCGDLAKSTDTSVSTDQCGSNSNAGIQDRRLVSDLVHLAYSGERKSCLSSCEQVNNTCHDSRAMDCRRQHKLCSWAC